MESLSLDYVPLNKQYDSPPQDSDHQLRVPKPVKDIKQYNNLNQHNLKATDSMIMVRSRELESFKLKDKNFQN